MSSINFSDADIQRIADAVAYRIEGIQRSSNHSSSEWLTVDEAAAYLRCSRSTLYEMDVPWHRPNKRRMFRKQDLDRWVKGE